MTDLDAIRARVALYTDPEWRGEDDEDFGYPAGWTHDEFAAAIVARMLGADR